jgi:hypothetical protein
MSSHRLFVGHERVPAITRNDFLWSEVGERGSFRTSVGPTGGELGTTSRSAIDLLRLAIAVYLVDRTTPRPREWSRPLGLTVPVSDPGFWNARSGAISGLLDYLTGDGWDVTFRRGPAIRLTRAAAARRSNHDLVVLFSGGMDSFAGAARATRSAQRPLLVGHWNWSAVRAIQSTAHRSLCDLTGSEPDFRPVLVGRLSRQIDGSQFGEERSSRSRSLLFLGLGVATATGTHARELWVPENGWTSLNVPLDGSRRGSLSTRTTHPGFLQEFNGLLADLGLEIQIHNPWEDRTKGDVVAWVASEWGSEAASVAFAGTYSCARSDMRFLGFPPDAHCGVCHACLVRRGAFLAADVPDATPYVEVMLRGDVARRASFMRSRGRDLAAVGAALARGGFSLADIIALDLPVRMHPAEALDLANRGLRELAAVGIP